MSLEKKNLRELWRARIQRLAKGRCELCAAKHPDLDPHHIVARKEYPGGDEASYNEENLVGLCSRCHLAVEAGHVPPGLLKLAVRGRR